MRSGNVMLLALGLGLTAGCNDDDGSEAEAEAEAESESETEAEGEVDCQSQPVQCDDTGNGCADGEVCLLDAFCGSNTCIGEDECRDENLCDALCCPLGTECLAGECPLADIFVDPLATQPYIETLNFSDNACELEDVEGPCIGGTGERRLLRFTTLTPNIGEGDMYMGYPNDSPELFDFSDCHGHYHFNSYARYTLVDKNGNEVGVGGKRAFCLIDLAQLDPEAGPPRFGCSLDGSIPQGISTGWADAYDASLPCQWIDITGVPSGEYTLRIELNFEHVIAEADYSNNVNETPVTICETDEDAQCMRDCQCWVAEVDCCTEENNCNYNNDGFCDCHGTQDWDEADCSLCDEGECTK